MTIKEQIIIPPHVKIQKVEPDQPRPPKPPLKLRLMPPNALDAKLVPWENMPEAPPLEYQSQPDAIDELIQDMLMEDCDVEEAYARIAEHYQTQE